MFAPALTARAAALIARYASHGLKIATAESCTGGLVAALLTEIPGSSAVLERGFVTYSNDAKRELLGVPAATLESHGAVGARNGARRTRPLACASRGQRHRRRRAGRRKRREAGRPRAFRMRGAGRGDRGDRAPVRRSRPVRDTDGVGRAGAGIAGAGRFVIAHDRFAALAMTMNDVLYVLFQVYPTYRPRRRVVTPEP